MSSTIDERPPAHARGIIAGRYRIVGRLGRGGMGTVYRAFDETAKRMLALKKCLVSDDDSKRHRQIRHFEREFHTLSHLAHPRVVEVYDYGVENILPYYTMELLDGGDLRELSPLPWRQVCAIIRDICSALSLLHSRRQLHGDLSPRNIRCTQSGKAKLMDFGAMVPMGVIPEVVGTPASTAPEMVDMLTLDARTDIFSLGTAAYFALTGRHAFPARHFNQLRDMWRSRPIPPSEIVPGIPLDLDSLVLSMLQIAPSARPSSDAEVFDKLAAIASLEPEEKLVVSRSYLTTPVMVGRGEPLHTVRKRMLRGIAMEGGSVLVSGPSGSGRSRFLDACVLEAGLTSAFVVRLDGLESGDESWAAVRTLVSRLAPNIGEITKTAVQNLLPVLGHILPELIADEDDGIAVSRVERKEFDGPKQLRPALQAALSDFVILMSRERYLVLAVDNIQAVDEPSLSFLALLSVTLPTTRIVLVATTEDHARPSSEEAMKLLRKNSETIFLSNLSHDETGTLLASVFGDVPNLSLLTDSMYRISRGNPQASMQLARHLVDRGIISYSAGAWTIPSQLEATDLPESLNDAFFARVQALGQEARDLVRTLALTPQRGCSFEECLDLAENRNEPQLIRTLDDLMAAEILFYDGARFTFCHQGWISALGEGLEDDERRHLHSKLAEMLYRHNARDLRTVHHFLLAGKEERALNVLLEDVLKDRALLHEDTNHFHDYFARLPGTWMTIFEMSIAAAERLERGERDLFLLREHLGYLAALTGAEKKDLFYKIFEQLSRIVGLDIYWQLEEIPDPLERLQRGLALAEARYNELPEEERVLHPLAAVRKLVQAVLNAAMVASMTLDIDFINSLPSIEPFIPLSPAVGVSHKLVEAARNLLMARYDQAMQLYREVLVRLQQEDRAGLEDTAHNQFMMGTNYALGLLETSFGIPVGLARADVIEHSPLNQVNAWCIRMLHHLRQGNLREAANMKRHVEQLRLQHRTAQFLEGTHLLSEVLAHTTADNLSGVRQCISDLERMTMKHEHWQPVLTLARGEYERIRGDYGAALSEFLPALEGVKAGQGETWPYVARAAINCLSALGRNHEALERGRELLAEADRNELLQSGTYIAMALAVVEAKMGHHERAIALSERVIHKYREQGTTGFTLGLAYEIRALVAVAMGDRAGFAEHAMLTAEQYKTFDNHLLKAKYEKLIQEARRAYIPVSEELARAADFSGRFKGKLHERVTDLLNHCDSQKERMRLALTILAGQTKARGGFLYSVKPEGAKLIAQLGNTSPGDDLENAVQDYIKSQLTDKEETTTVELTDITTKRFHWPETGQEYYQPVLLGHMDARGYRLTALAVLIVKPGDKFERAGETTLAISKSLHQFDELPGVIL